MSPAATLYFQATDPNLGVELFKLDETPDAVPQVIDINPGPGSSTPHAFRVFNDTLYFVADDGTHGAQMWSIIPGAAPQMLTNGLANIGPATLIGNTLLFQASDATHGLELR